MKRRLFSLFLALTLVVGMLPAPAFAQETESTQATQAPTEASTPTEAPRAEPTQAPTEAPTEAPAAEPAQPVAEAQSTEPPAQVFAEPAQDEAVAAVQAMIDALPDVEDMSESYLDALEAAYSAFDALSETQQAQITGVEKLEALFGWVNSQVSTLVAEETISGKVTWDNRTFAIPVKLTGDTTLTLTGTNRIECDQPLDLNGKNLTIQGTGTLELVGKGGNNYLVGATLCDSTWTGSSSSSGGTLTLAGGTVKVSGSLQNAVCVYNLKLNGGNLEAHGGENAGIVCALLETTSGSLYATGDDYGISMYYPYFYGSDVNKLDILVSNKKDADIAEMESSDEKAIKNARRGDFRTVYIGKVSGPMLSVKAQKGYLYEGTADQTATFSYSAKNLDGCMFGVEWTGAHPGLTAGFSESVDQTIIVTTENTVKKGTYELKLTAANAESAETLATKTFTVTVLGAPITVTTQPKDAFVSCKRGDLDSWQGDKKIQVTAKLAAGLTDPITYQWKLEGGTKLDSCTGYELFLQDLFVGGKLPPVAGKSWLHSAKVYCTLTYGSHSVNTNAVTLTVNTCAHENAKPDGNCRQCGEPCSSEPLLVREDGAYYAVDTSGIGDAEVGGGILTSGGTFYLTKDVLSRDMNAGNYTAGSENVILDLQGHTLNRLKMGNFPYGSFTLKNGTLGVIDTSASGKLILENIHYKDTIISAQFELTVRGENTHFELPVAFRGTTHLRGGHFDGGLDSTCVDRALELLDDGFAFYNSANEVVDATDYTELVGREIHVASHTCHYSNGKCECGRTCDHKTVNADGYCTFCHALVEPYAIGQTRYKSLEAALDAANAGDTITLRGDFYQGYKTVKINKNVTLNLGGHTLTGDADGEPVLLILAENVTIQNGTVENTNSAKSSPAVKVGYLDVIGGLTTKNVTFIGGSNGVDPQQYALFVTNGSQATVKSGTFTGGIYVEGSLTMTGGSATSLELGSSQGKAELSGGTFDSIHFDADADYLGLLDDGYAYRSGGKFVKPADMNDSTKVEIAKCIHPDGLTADTACPYCGKKCGHGNINQTTGLCPECGYQAYRAKIGDTLYETAQAALDAATDRQGVTLLANDTLPDNYVLDKVITLDMNSKKLTGSAMTVTGEVTVPSSGSLDVPMEITGKLTLNGPATLLQDVSVRASGTLILDRSTAAAAGTISVYESGRFELRDGSIGKLHIDGGTATLSAGRIMKSVTVKNGNLQSILAEGKALLLKADGTVIDGTRSAALGNMEIVDHTHTFGEGGKCACGQTAPVQVVAGTESIYYGDFESAVSKAMTLPNSTVRLLKDVTYSGDSSIYIDGGTFTIDWNGHTLSGSFWGNLLTISGPANVTLTDGSDTNTGGARQTGKGAAVRIAVGSEGRVNIQGGTYSPNVTRAERCYGSVQISGGVFENPKGYGQTFALYNASGSLSGMLADGTAFAYGEDGSDLLNAYDASQSNAYTTVYAVEHTHENWTDGVCDCGYTCPHEHWTDGVCDLCGYECLHEEWKDGKCAVCGYPCPHEDVTEKDGVYTCDICGLTMTVMVETADGNVSYTTDLAAALNDAEDGTTVKLLSDLVLTKSANIIGGNKTVTLNLNGHNITRAGWQIIQVKGNTDDGTKAKLVITGSGEIRFNVKAADGGQLDMSDWTGTVEWVDLENACDFVGPTGDGHLGALNISNWRSDNQGTILLQGGTIGQLWLNSFDNSFQMNLGSLLKAGCAAKSGSEYLPYDRAIQNGGSVNDLTIVPCPHTGLDGSGRCTYCNATDFVATVTKNGVTAGYTDFQSALDEICDGKRGTLKLLKDVPVEEGHPFGRISGILDLNGKNLACDLTCIQGSSLQIVNRGSDMSRMERLEVWNGAKVTIADTAGSIHFNVVWVESGSVADLLPEGSAYFRTDRQTWISAAEAARKQTLENVAVKEVPVKSVTLTANKTSVPYGQSQTVTLTASATLSGGFPASYDWAELMPYGPDWKGGDEASFTLPAGVNAGEHTYRVSVTAGGYTLSKDIQITVTKAPGKLENKDYPTEFTYGDTVPTPKAENFTSNHPDGTFSYYWLTGDGSIRLETGANPTRAGTYMLCATWTAGTNHTTASLSLAVTIQKANQTANITVVNETISGKGDGGVTLLPSAEGYEMRKKGETTFEPIPASQGQTFVTLAPGVYEIRLAETKNYLSTAPQEVTVQPGRKLKVTLPENPKGYTLTASKTQLDWHENVELTFQLNPVGAYKAADFGIWAEAGSEKTKLTLGNDGAVKLTAPEKDITITVTGVKTDNVAPKVFIRGRLRKDSGYYVKWEGFQENPADDFVNGDFVISATDRGSDVASLWHYLSKTPLTLADMDTVSWKQEGKVSITEDGVYYLYAKALDNANNAGYACTGKLVKESNPPTFSGVKDGETYYVSQQMEIHDDGMPDWYMAKGSIGVVPNGGNENPIKLRLPNNGSSYTFTVGDRCGNEATITVYMKPLTDLTQPLYSILEGSIQKTDRTTLDDVEATLKGLDVTYATEPEKKEINDALARIAQLRQVLDQVAAVEAQIDALPDSVEPYQQTVEDTKIKPARDAYNSLTDHQKTLVDSAKLDKLVRLEAQLNAWTITEGDGQIWYKGSGKSLSFTVNGQSRKFDGIRQGSTYIGSGVSSLLTASGEMDKPFTLTLKPEFLQCQTPGEHSFAVWYGDLSISVTYTVETPTNYLDVTDREEFEGKTTVTVDGKEYPIEEMAGYLQRIPTQRYVNLPETGDLLTIYSFKDGTPTGSYTNYPTGMQVFRITRQEGGAKAEEITEFANLLNYAGCSIRVSGKKGIRMITGIDQNVKKSLVSKAGLAGYTLEEYGTVVQWADKLGSNTLNLDNSNKKNYAYKKGKADPIFAKENGMIQYTNVLVGFTDAQCQPDLVMRPYIKLIDTATGETVTLYGGSVTRSIGYVAWQNRDTYKQGTASYKYVWNIIDSVDTSKYPN